MESERVIACLWCNTAFTEIPPSGVCPKCGYNHFNEYNRRMESGEYQGVIIKFGNCSTLDSMRSGSVWFQSPKYYQEYKGNPAICDVSECAYDYIMDLPLEKIQGTLPFHIGDKLNADGKEIILKQIVGAKACVYSDTQNYNRLLCFYLLRFQNNILEKRDEKLKSFGTHFALLNYKKLIQKVSDYANANDLFFSPSCVKYSTGAYRGAYNPTFKDESYAYQNEYRFILRGDKLNAMDEREPLKIRIDGMDEIITEPQPMEKLFEVDSVDKLFELFDIGESGE